MFEMREIRRHACGRRWAAWARLLLACAMVSAIAVAGGGCAAHYVELRRAPKNPLAEQLKLSAENSASDRTMQVLRQYALTGELVGDPRKLLTDLQAIVEREPSAEKLYSFAELSYRAGRQMDPKNERAALDFYGAAVAYSYLYLFDERFASLRNPYDPEFRGACDLYNGSLEASLRILNKQGALQPGRTHSTETATQRFDVTVVTRGSAWKTDDFAEFKFVSDYKVKNLTNLYQGYGLGVPLIAVYKPHPNRPREQFYPPGLTFPVTAFMRLLPDEGGCVLRAGARHRALIELHDPLASPDILLGSRRVPLESDLSTPLAYFLNRPVLTRLADYGLLLPDQAQSLTGLYMLQPYQPEKIPIVLVHGLWSSPLTWTEMFNDLRSQAEINQRYQIWFYLYPTGQPFWTSATRMRDDLARMRQVLDPEHREAALDQMVLVGHSMGGLIARLQTLNSRDDFWHIESNSPFAVVQASAQVRQKLEHLFFFQPNASVRRVITIATPHRGSRFANQTTRLLAQKVISLPKMVGREQVVKDNPALFKDTSLLEVKTSFDSLAPDSPILPTMLQAERPPWVRYHNIVGLVPDKGLWGVLHEEGDGVVPYASAHLDDVRSEITVDADHMNVHRHPLSVLEVRRILLEHLADLERGYELPPNQAAAAVPTLR
jgi:pimeloyl-ACP methyl ester carboxylesterase